jgi:dipeptide/tripeptide permease
VVEQAVPHLDTVTLLQHVRQHKNVRDVVAQEVLLLDTTIQYQRHVQQQRNVQDVVQQLVQHLDIVILQQHVRQHKNVRDVVAQEVLLLDIICHYYGAIGQQVTHLTIQEQKFVRETVVIIPKPTRQHITPIHTAAHLVYILNVLYVAEQ